MRSSNSGRVLAITALGAALLAGTLAALAAVTPIDFTGHWTGSASGPGQSPITLVVDLTSSGRTFTGTLVSTQDGQITSCTLNGKQKGRSKIKATLTPCRTVLQGKFDLTTDTITGHFVRHGRHRTQT